MRYVVLGAGAVGSAVGALLADSGHDVALVARGDHVEAMRRGGLRVATPDRVLQLDLPAYSDAAAVGLRDGDVLVLATKTQQSEALLDTVAPLEVGERTAAEVLPVFCMQNGVANERIAARRFARVYGVVVMMPAVLLDPGRVEAQGAPYSGLLDVGRWPSGTDETASVVAEALSRSNLVSRSVPDVMRWKHAKLLRNLGNAIEALVGHGLDEAAMELVFDIERRMRDEAEACFRAAGIDWASDEEWTSRRRDQVQHALVEGRSRRGGSTWQSLARGAGSVETDYLNGEIVLLGREYGVPTPVNLTLQRLATRAARDQMPPGALTPQEIEKEIRT